MPTSPSPRRGAKAQSPAPPPARPRSLWPRLAFIGAVAIIVVAVCVLPASLVARFLPPTVQAEDFSGSIWHGSAGRITANGRPAGALEWSLHPLGLARLHLLADLHWVKGGFALDGSADVTRTHFAASNISGGGPIQDLRDFGLGAGWHGAAAVRIASLTADLTADGAVLPTSAVGDVAVSDVSSPQIAAGSALGSFDLRFDDPAAISAAGMKADLTDTGGPLSLNATLEVSMKTRSGLLSGTVEARPGASPALQRELDNLSQLHARDAAGRLPVDLEFTF
jgi:hypothetical protein